MKKRLAILLLSALVLTCVFTSLSVGVAAYTDDVNLLPKSTDVIQQNSAEQNGVAEFALTDDGLSLTRAAESQIYWPSIKYEVLEEVDLSKTPYLHLQFTCSSEGENEGRGVNGHVMYTVDGGEEQDGWFSEIGGRDVNDYRGSTDAYFDFTKVANTTGKITITQVILSIYGDAGETVVWNALAFASNGEGSDEPSDEPSEEEPSDEPSEEESSEVEASEETSSVEASSEAPAESTTPDESSAAPTTSANASTDASSEAPTDSDGIGTLAIVLIVVGCVAVVAVVVIIIVKKKK